METPSGGSASVPAHEFRSIVSEKPPLETIPTRYIAFPEQFDREDLAWQEMLVNRVPSASSLMRPGAAPDMPSPSSDPVRSLDDTDGFLAQYFGLSGETDPYLIRHFRFASESDCRFFKVHFRRVAAEWNDLESAVPVHFMTSSDKLGNLMKAETTLQPEY
ncbi:hypothetical protein GQ53DRAFT_820911 [Thozetella sp. PMI_491]|nr:hypothetical protein GQ53DRAFT_820911 [Thozetella sp. PMI_491]